MQGGVDQGSEVPSSLLGKQAHAVAAWPAAQEGVLRELLASASVA